MPIVAIIFLILYMACIKTFGYKHITLQIVLSFTWIVSFNMHWIFTSSLSVHRIGFLWGSNYFCSKGYRGKVPSNKKLSRKLTMSFFTNLGQRLKWAFFIRICLLSVHCFHHCWNFPRTVMIDSILFVLNRYLLHI